MIERNLIALAWGIPYARVVGRLSLLSAMSVLSRSKFFLALVFVACAAGCSPGYVVRAAYEQSRILLARRPIAEVIEDPATLQADRDKLALVLAARGFAADIGLQPGDSFTQYADIGKDTLAWVVMASRKDSFAMYSWWFPIVGTVPYKGFFERNDALEQVRSLKEQGYETSVRGTEAFSTLGWFNDPLLSTTLKNPTTRIINTVIHESVHPTVWIKNNVPFNESLANFVGSRGTVDFFRMRQQVGGLQDQELQAARDELAQAERDHRTTMDFADCVSQAFERLSALYGRQDLTPEQKIAQRQGVFDEAMAPLRSRYPSFGALRVLNNAELLQTTIYTTKLGLFERLHIAVKGSWPAFFAQVAEVQRRVEHGEDPFEALGAMVLGDSK